MLDKLFEIIQWAFEALIPFVIIPEYQRAVHLRLGKFKRELGPGLHWKIPLHFDVVLDEYVVPRTKRIAGLSTTTADGESIGFEAVITWSISNIRKALLEVHDLEDAVADSCAGIIGTELSKAEWHAIWHGEVTEDLSTVCRKRGWKWGIEVHAVQLVGVARVRNLRISHSGGPSANHLGPVA